MKIAVVTGSSTGLGFATAVALARAGHEVFGTMRDPARSPELAALAAQEGLPLTVLPLDVDSDTSVAAAFAQVRAMRGRVDVLVNNAGIAGLGSVEHTPLDLYRQIMETNYFGVLRCIQAVLPGMRERRSGHIINVSSIAGRIASNGQSAYCASKHAVEALSETLAVEVKPFEIRVAIVEPGVIHTPIFGKGRDLAGDSYTGPRRMNALFAASLEQPVPATVVGEQIRDIVGSGSWQLRHPSGPAAAGILAWRGSMSDEAYIELGAIDDSAWCDYVENTLGLGVRKYMAGAET